MNTPIVTAGEVARVVIEQGVSLAEAHRQVVENRPKIEQPNVVTDKDWRKRRHQASGILAAMQMLGINRQELSERTGIPYSILCSKVRGAGAITAVELAVIADALDIDAATLLAPLDTYMSEEDLAEDAARADLDALIDDFKSMGFRINWDEFNPNPDGAMSGAAVKQYLDDGQWFLLLSKTSRTAYVLDCARRAWDHVLHDSEGRVWFCRAADPDVSTSRPSRSAAFTVHDDRAAGQGVRRRR